MTIKNETRIQMYERMITSRKLEDVLIPVYWEEKLPAFNMRKGPLPGEMHWSRGQEPVGAGVCAALGDDDIVTAAHRPHHVAIGRNVDLKKMTAEILQRETGLSRGKGGHMHLYDASTNFSCWSIVGGTMGLTAGMAMANKMQKKPGVAVTVIGEGAVNEGHWHETMNMAALWKLPFICVIEDNYYGVTVAKPDSTAIERNSDRASAYGCFGEYVEGNDADLICAATQRAVERANNGEGPSIIEVQTARLEGHYAGDAQAYVPQSVKDDYLIDALPIYRERLLSENVINESELQAMEQRVDSEVAEAVQFARDSDHISVDELHSHVYA